jgi:hypothetical protein
MTAMRIAVAIGCVVVLNGCSSRFFLNKVDDRSIATMAGTEQVAYHSHFDKIDVPELIRMHSNSSSEAACSKEQAASRKLPETASDEEKLAYTATAETRDIASAYVDFYRCVMPSERLERRNRIQSAIMTAAARNCEVYKHLLSTVESDTSFGFGAISTITGVLGGAIKGAAPGLAAASGISSGFSRKPRCR